MFRTSLILLSFLAYCIFGSPTIEDDGREFSRSEIIELPVGRFPEPNCQYSVHHNDKLGSIVRSEVNIGDKIYHYWNCDIPGNDPNRKNYLFCIVVNNCTVSDTDGRSEDDEKKNIQIIDDHGCSVFPSILPDIKYHGDLSAGIEVHAFSLDVDKTAVHFTCNIRMVLKENDICQRPKCSGAAARRRFARYITDAE